MKQYFSILLILLCFNANARLEALNLNLDSEDSFNTLCLENDIWENCPSAVNNIRPGEYMHTFHSPHTQESIAIGYIDLDNGDTSFVAACRENPSANWTDCTPNAADMAAGDYSAYRRPSDDGQGALMIVGRGENGTLIATCRNASGVWRDCSPTLDTTDFYVDGVSYANHQWIVLSNSLEWVDEETSSNAAFCMNPNGDWENCDLTIKDPTGDLYWDVWNYNLIQYVPQTQEWVAVGLGGDEVFKSICRKNNDTYWHDCTNGIFPSNTADFLVQNHNGELVQLNHILSGISLSTQLLCKSPNAGWTDCSGNLNEKNHAYNGITLDANGDWVLVGYHMSTNLSENLAHLTAKGKGGDWEILRQEPETAMDILLDVMWIE